MDNKTHITRAEAQAVPEWWPLIRNLVEDACTYSMGRYIVSDVLRLLLNGHMELWVIVNKDSISGIAIMEIVVYPQLREYRGIVGTGKDLPLWIHHIEEIEAYAKSIDCKIVTLNARPGWERPMKKFDYVKTHVNLEKELGYVH